MVRLLVTASILILVSLSGFAQTNTKREVAQNAKLYLRNGWRIQSSAQVKEKGDALSQNNFQPQKWYPATVPSTIVGTLVEDKVRGQPVSGYVVVSNTASDSRKLSRPEYLATLRRN